MLFSSSVFIFLFLPVVIAIYFLINKPIRNYFLLAASLIFYAWGEPRYLAIMLFMIVFNYFGTWLLGKFPQIKKAILIFVIVTDLTSLFYFKYFDFFINNINAAFSTDFSLSHVVMPIGISFFTFQCITYFVDVYRGEVNSQKDIYKLGLYISLFPHLIAGPIVKYHDIYTYLENRQDSLSNLTNGIKRFTIGLGKKVLLANTLGEAADKIFTSSSSHGIEASIAWLGIICYTLQIFFDFSGYSDMAIGLARVFGFKFPENFNYPYISLSITEFWRRWHISLSTWFKEYLYIPLGGNRKGKYRTYANLAIVFFATGLWHGAGWTFILWGIWHGIFIIIEKITNLNTKSFNNLSIIMKRFYMIFVVMIGWVLFRSENINHAWIYIKSMLGLLPTINQEFGLTYYTNGKLLLVLIVSLFMCTPVLNKLTFDNKNSKHPLFSFALNLLLIIIFVISAAYIIASTYNPFIYFRF